MVKEQINILFSSWSATFQIMLSKFPQVVLSFLSPCKCQCAIGAWFSPWGSAVGLDIMRCIKKQI